MTDEAKRQLKVFLCHASGDKLPVRELYKRLLAEGVDAWLDQEKLLPGQDWRVEIPRAVREADAVVICLSNKSITKEGYVQREIQFALDSNEEKPEGTIFLIPARLEECPVPERLARWQWVDLFDENGFMKLLRSLKMRADKVGAVIQPSGYEDVDQELERRLDQLYTEGLAAFWVEEWDRACQRFQAILRERPSHKDAAEKLAEAERQRNLLKLYDEAREAYQAENWPVAIKALEDLLAKSGNYKDAVQLLKNAKKQRQLNDLYAEAKRLHAAQKWQPVIRIFEQIAGIDASFSDPENLYPSAQKELAELKRLEELNSLYRQAVHQMDAGKWQEARDLLEKVQQAQAGFLDTERLLRKTENEILRIEETNRRTIQVNSLYEQVHSLIRSKSWRKALDKMEEIQKLDSQFVDKDGIFAKAKTELQREEQEAQRQRELDALYAEAVSLLGAKKYQEALEKWNTLQAMDPTYKDVARVRIIAKRKLDQLARPETAGRQWPTAINDWFTADANVPADREILTERLLLLSFVCIFIIDILYFVIQRWLNIRESGDLAEFITYMFLGGLYGAVLAFTLNNTIDNWSRKQSLVVLFGWALAQSVPWLVRKFFDIDFITLYALFAGLSITVAIKWARPASGPINLIMVFVSWILAWKAGGLLGSYLQEVFNTQYMGAIGDPFSVLLGLLFTFGMQTERSGEILRIAFFGALGFAAGNYLIDNLSFLWVSVPAAVGTPVALGLWGLVGGAILEAPSRNARRIMVLAGLCGLGLLLSHFIGLVVVPAVLGQPFLASPSPTIQEQAAILRNLCRGIGLALGLGLLVRRISAIGVLSIAGAGLFMITYIMFRDSFEISSTPDAVRGALVGLVFGYGYGYMSGAKRQQNISSVLKTEPV